MKTCTKCKESKPNTNEYFAKNKACKDGLNTICKQCIRDYGKRYYHNNKDKAKEYRQTNKDKMVEYLRDWRERNPNYKKNYYEANRDEMVEYQRNWTERNPNYKKNYYEANKDEMAEYRRNWKKRNPNYDKNYYEANREQIRFHGKKWKVKNREKLYQSARVRQLNKSKGDYSLDEWGQTKMYFDNRCAYCGVSSDVLSQDHFIPLSKGGSYTKDNIIPACIRCNSSKNNTDFKEWFTKQDFYNFDRLQKIENYLKEIEHNGKTYKS